MKISLSKRYVVLLSPQGDYTLNEEDAVLSPNDQLVYGPAPFMTCKHYIANVTNDIFRYFYEDRDLISSQVTQPDVDIQQLKEKFKDWQIPYQTQEVEDYAVYLTKEIFPFTINTGSSQYIGHMTSQLPYFHKDLSAWLISLNQNMVKIETSKVLTFLEREALAMLHHRFYQFDKSFYDEHIQNNQSDLGLLVGGGTLANLTALWVARNQALTGIEKIGFVDAMAVNQYLGAKILVSPLLHYSIKKASSLLGIGMENIEQLSLLNDGQIDTVHLQQRIEQLQKGKIKVIAIIGIAGATETGSIDPLKAMGEIAKQSQIHFHVDASFGGPMLFSTQYRHLLTGIDSADSITICGHKQLYLPIGTSMCLFRSPKAMQAIRIGADYQAMGSTFDFGKSSPEGTRPANALYLHASLHILGESGYEKLMDNAMQLASYFKERILANEAFELLWEPQLNVINYRYISPQYRLKCREGKLNQADNQAINEVNTHLQRTQFARGNSFISMTSLPYLKGQGEVISLRAVLFNPLTQHEHIDAVLNEQLKIASELNSLRSAKG
jgi:putative pyridoxal-dependent aspartate 1-decarboxylase